MSDISKVSEVSDILTLSEEITRVNGRYSDNGVLPWHLETLAVSFSTELERS